MKTVDAPFQQDLRKSQFYNDGSNQNVHVKKLLERDCLVCSYIKIMRCGMTTNETTIQRSINKVDVHFCKQLSV